ncbi:toll/interleukin-1 receptor domain-containing protein [Butyrivibrio sp. FCS014]|uniref:toll/interleukin-1 receptor domain-containing protein n=1 Tax=Butyrivibrio sp. FCS014 TaxID=1408304 RepID=UPI000466EAAE|nr:toll/interleukin-1 receptor domain-containing protein [Butyrivibrio sp. FCS014]
MTGEDQRFYYMEHPAKAAGRQLRKTERVYLCSCPEDIEAAKEISGTIQQMYQADIWISKGAESSFDRGYLEAVLGGSFTMVALIVSGRLLGGSDAPFKDVLKAAVDLGIRILPIAIEPGVSARFSEVYGHMQVLDYCGSEAKARLKHYIDGYVDLYTVIDDEGPAIPELFSFHIFMSYRKKNLVQLTELMKKIRRWPEHLDTSIWYDDALVEGENYDDQILEQLKGSDVILLVMTPDVLEEGNYVLRCELPDARRFGKRVITFVTEETDPEALGKHSDFTGEVVYDLDALRLILKEEHDKAAGAENNLTDEAAYKLGLCYLAGNGTARDPMMGEIALDVAARSGHPYASARLGQILFEKGDPERGAAYMENALDLLCRIRQERGGLSGNEMSTMGTADKLMRILLHYYIGNIMYLEAWNMLHKVETVMMAPPNLQYGMVYTAAGAFEFARRTFANIEEDIQNQELFSPGIKSLSDKCEFYANYGETIVCMLINGQLDVSKAFTLGRYLLETAMDAVVEMAKAAAGTMDLDIVYRVDYYYFCMIGIAADSGDRELVAGMFDREEEFLDAFGIREAARSGRGNPPHFFPVDLRYDSLEELKRKVDARTCWSELFVTPAEPAEIFPLQENIEGVFGDIDGNAVISSYQCPFCRLRMYKMVFSEGNDPDLYLGRDRKYILNPARVFLCPGGHMYAVSKGHRLTDYPVFMASPVVDKDSRLGRGLFDMWWKYFDSIADINARRKE